jgi:hypothetical protein
MPDDVKRPAEVLGRSLERDGAEVAEDWHLPPSADKPGPQDPAHASASAEAARIKAAERE